MLAVNYVLLRRAIEPLQRLTRVMRTVDPLAPGRRAELPAGPAEVAELGASFDQMLDRLESERRESARRALTAQEEERIRIARELHDEVGQALTAVLLQLDRADAGGEAGERIQEAREAARATLEEVRAIARNLRPEALDDLGLAAAVRQLCNDAERAGVLVEREIAADVRLDPEVEVVVYRVAEDGDGAEAVRQALRDEVELAVLDVSMPTMTGLQAAAEISRRRPGLPMLMLSMHDSEQYLYEALKAGASGYVLKSGADRDLVDACRAALRGEPFLYPAAVSRLIADALSRAEEPPDPLTPRELQVLKLIAEAHTTEQIANLLVISPRTVERHRENLLGKLGMRDRVELTRYAIRRGLVEP